MSVCVWKWTNNIIWARNLWFLPYSILFLRQEFVNKVHYHMVKEYVSQLMKNNYSCKNRKHEKAAAKMRAQWACLQDLFEELVSESFSLFQFSRVVHTHSHLTDHSHALNASKGHIQGVHWTYDHEDDCCFDYCFYYINISAGRDWLFIFLPSRNLPLIGSIQLESTCAISLERKTRKI